MGRAHSCEAVPRVDVVVRRKPSPRIIPARASWSRGFPPPARVVVHLASLALFISFWLPFAVGHEGEGDDAPGDDAGGGDDARGVICCPIISLYYVGRTEEEEEEEDNMGSGLFE